MGRVVIVCIIGFVLPSISGCAGPKWCHDQGTFNFERDKRECMHQAASYANSWGSAGNPFIILDDTQNCLRDKGYYHCSNKTD